MENGVFVLFLEGLAERLRHSHDEDIAAPVVLAFHLTEATQNDDVAHLLGHSLDGCLNALRAVFVMPSTSMYAFAASSAPAESKRK